MHVHDRCCSLAGCFSTYLLAFACTKWELCLYIKNLKLKLFQMSPPYLPICGITLPSQVNLHVPPLKTSNKYPFCVSGLFIERQEVVGIFHAKQVILRLSVYSLTIAQEKSGNMDSLYQIAKRTYQ